MSGATGDARSRDRRGGPRAPADVSRDHARARREVVDRAVLAVVQRPQPVDQPADDREPADDDLEQQLAPQHEPRADRLAVVANDAQADRLLAQRLTVAHAAAAHRHHVVRRAQHDGKDQPEAAAIVTGGLRARERDRGRDRQRQRDRAVQAPRAHPRPPLGRHGRRRGGRWRLGQWDEGHDGARDDCYAEGRPGSSPSDRRSRLAWRHPPRAARGRSSATGDRPRRPERAALEPFNRAEHARRMRRP